MKQKIFKKIISPAITTILILSIAGCGGSKKENPVEHKSVDASEVKKPATQETSKKEEKYSFENETLLALELHTMDQEAIYDADSPVIVRVELYSPRTFAVLNHNQYKPKEAEAELPEAKIDNSAKPYTSPGGQNGELEPQAYHSPLEEKLDLGKGEVGSVSIILREKSFPKAGKYSLKAEWKSDHFGLIKSENLSITMVTGHMSAADQELERVKVLLTMKKNKAALDKIKKLAEKNPDSYAIRYHLAEAHEKNDNLKEALTHYQKALTLFPEEEPGEPWEPPIGLYIKIRELMEKLKNHEKQLISKTNHVDQN